MHTKPGRLIQCGLIAMLLVGSAAAHHSFAMFDRSREITISGKVKEFQWMSPHSWIQVMVPDAAGNLQEWSVEMYSPAVLVRNGWKSSTLRQGDVVRLVINPLRDGRAGGSFVSVELADGRKLLGSQPGPK